MFKFYGLLKAKKHLPGAVDYLSKNLIIPKEEFFDDNTENCTVKFKIKTPGYNEKKISNVLKNTKDAEQTLKQLEETINPTFVDGLLEHISAKSLKDSQVYKKANIDKRLFSKIAGDRNYKPSKDTVIALALALELTLSDTNELLSRAGFSLSHSIKRDVIIEYFFREKIYNPVCCNEILHKLRQKPIGRV